MTIAQSKTVYMRGPTGRVHKVTESVAAMLEQQPEWSRAFERSYSTDRLMRSNRSVCG